MGTTKWHHWIPGQYQIYLLFSTQQNLKLVQLKANTDDKFKVDQMMKLESCP